MPGCKKHNFRNAFTLSELLIALGIIGILTAILMPIFFNLMPDQNALMAKRAFYTTETVISDLLNDPDCYPKILARAGLDDGMGYTKCSNWGEDKTEEKPSGTAKKPAEPGGLRPGSASRAKKTRPSSGLPAKREKTPGCVLPCKRRGCVL